jgi:DNA-binding transcriptional ArsR family regulator
MPMRPEDIPRRQERLVLADATQKFERLLIKRIFATDDIAAFAELAFIARALWSATLRGKKLTAQQIAHTIGMPRTTVSRKLLYLSKLGYVTQDGSAYVIGDAALRSVSPLLDRAIALILETAAELHAVQNGQQMRIVQNGQQNR